MDLNVLPPPLPPEDHLAASEEDVCRICRAGSEEGTLMYPCSCRGSMRFVHDHCLKGWNDITKKERCELCGTQLKFNRVFAAMPDRLPVLLLLRNLSMSFVYKTLFLLRMLLVAFTWLAVLPYCVLWIVRYYFYSAHGVAGAVGYIFVKGGREAMRKSTASGMCENVQGDLLKLMQTKLALLNVNRSWCWSEWYHHLWSETVQGQILTVALILSCVAGFLLREFILQNAAALLAPPNHPAQETVVEIIMGVAAQRGVGDEAARRGIANLLLGADVGQVEGFLRAAQDAAVAAATIVAERGGDGLPDELNIELAANAWEPEVDQEEQDDSYHEEEYADDDGNELDFWEDEEEEEEEEDGGVSGEEEQIENDVEELRVEAQESMTSHPTSGSGRPIRALPNRDRLHTVPTAAPKPATPLAVGADLVQDIPPFEIRQAPLLEYRPAPGAAPDLPGIVGNLAAREGAARAARRRRHRHHGNEGDDEEDNVNDVDTEDDDEDHEGEEEVPPEVVPRGVGDDDFLEDLDGILVAVGLRGHIVMLGQNFALMLVLISVSFAAIIFLPLLIGKSITAGNAVRIVTLPLKAIRILSDPFFDFLLSIPLYLVSKIYTPAPSTNPTKFVSILPTMLLSGVRTFLGKVDDDWRSMAVNDTTRDRVLCVTLGYCTALVGAGIYIATRGEYYRQQWIRTLTQHSVILKVVIFVFIEIIVFPATCGSVINLVTIPLFDGVTLQSRIKYYLNNPVSALFLTWLTGTLYMFIFSCTIDVYRSIARPGVLFWIRDPDSLDYNPINEIVERKAVTQARKILFSASLYCGIILSTAGMGSFLLRYTIGPLRWTYVPLTDIPIDLIVYRFILPVVLRYLDPRSYLESKFVAFSRFSAARCRLSSFLYGMRVASEEIEPKAFARVPAVDAVRVVPARRMIIRVQEDGCPLPGDEEAIAIIAQQIVEMVTTRKQDKYQIVYLPPHFKTRVTLYIFCLLFGSSAAVVCMFIVPTLVGRYLFSHFTTSDVVVHDLYSAAVGFAFIFSFSLLYQTTKKIARPTFRLQHLITAVKLCYTFVLAVLILPFLLHLYFHIILPNPISLLITALFSNSTSPTTGSVRILKLNAQAWCSGAILLSIMYTAFRRRWVITSSYSTALNKAVRYWRTDRKSEAIGLLNIHLTWLVVRILIVLCTPMAGIVALGKCYPASLASDKQMLTVVGWAYTISGMANHLYIAREPLVKAWNRYKQSVKEDEYLVERVLLNHE